MKLSRRFLLHPLFNFDFFWRVFNLVVRPALVFNIKNHYIYICKAHCTECNIQRLFAFFSMCGNNSRGSSTLRPLRQAQGPQGLRDLLSTLLFFFTIIQAWCWTGAENLMTHFISFMGKKNDNICTT